MESKKQLTIWYRKNGEDRELVREVPGKPEDEGVLLHLLGHEPIVAPLKDFPGGTTYERLRSQLQDRGIEVLKWECVDVE